MITTTYAEGTLSSVFLRARENYSYKKKSLQRNMSGVLVSRQSCRWDQWPANSIFIFHRYGRTYYKEYVRERDCRALDTNQSLIT